ncbi:MAG: type II secretion system protein [Clostridiales bacterium]|nr:type II secretion system protein [Clostridiales bacterium]MDY5726308.1 type II secretion system protein [Eubacteriales bacterium]
MKKNNKKGFTIVELVIVIAVIAILAAVLIPTFSSIIKKAKISNDTVLAKNLTTAIATESITSKPTSMEEVVTKLYNAGFVLENLSPTTEDYFYGWDSKNNQIILISDECSVVYESATSTPVDVYVTTTGKFAQKLANAGYSLYLTTDATEVKTNNFINVDTGNSELGTLEMTATNDGEVTLKGKINNVKVKNPNGSVKQYASSETLLIEDIKVGSYHVYGEIKTVTLEQGKLVVEQLGKIGTLKVANAIVADISAKVENKGTITKATNTDGTEIKNNDIVKTNNNITIGDYAELVAFRDQVNNGRHFENVVVKLTADIDISGRPWTPIGAGDRNKEDTLYFAGTFDGNNRTITGLTNKGMNIGNIKFGYNSTTPKDANEVVYGFFGVVRNATIKNLKMANVDIDLIKVVNDNNVILGDSVGAVVGYAGNIFANSTVTIENCSVLSGKIAGFDGVAGILGRSYATTITITNCSNAATVTAPRRVAGILGFISKKAAVNVSLENVTLNVTGCTNTGSISCTANEADYGVTADGSYHDADQILIIGIAGIENNGTNNNMNGTVTGKKTGK